jgi:hypothetical protein
MKFDLLSDLHIDINKNFRPQEPNPGSEVLVLAGDIAEIQSLRHTKFQIFKEYKDLYKEVVYVAGNHEFYGANYQRTNEILEHECGNIGVRFLQPDCGRNYFWEHDGVLFVGGTLWTDCNKLDPITLSGLKQMMADFSWISYGDSTLLPSGVVPPFSPDQSAREHAYHLHCFDDVISRNKDKKVVLVTHHAMSEKSVVAYFRGQYIMNGGFMSQRDDFFDKHRNIMYHCHGHMHNPLQYYLFDTEVNCNPYGYRKYGEGSSIYGPRQLEVI